MNIPVEILDNRTGEPVEAELFDDVTVAHFIETQQIWRPLVQIATLKIAQSGKTELIPQHYHWDWTSKAPQLGQLSNVFYGLRCAGHLQALMMLETVGTHSSGRLAEQKGKALVYIDYVETAPWNLKPLAEVLEGRSRYSAVGTRMIEAAVRRSREEDCKGRLGLHSLPLSEPFYSRVCGMTPVGRDPAKQNLLWFEFTPEQAERFLTRGAS